MWTPSSQASRIEALQNVDSRILDPADPCLLVDQLKSYQQLFADGLTCRQRRHQRMPFQLRDAYARAANCTDNAQRRNLRESAWTLRKQWVQRVREQTACDRVRSGCALTPNKKLHRVKQMLVDDTPTLVQNVWARTFHDYYSNKWHTGNAEAKVWVMNHILRSDAEPLDIKPDQVKHAFQCLKNEID